MLGLLAQYLGRKVAELGPEGLLQFFALGFSAARSSAFFARSDAISASDEARSAASSASVRVRCSVSACTCPS